MILETVSIFFLHNRVFAFTLFLKLVWCSCSTIILTPPLVSQFGISTSPNPPKPSLKSFNFISLDKDLIMAEIDLEQGAVYDYHRRSFGDVSVYYSDGEDMTSCYSYFYSTTGGGGGGSYEYEGESRKVSMSSSEIYDDDDDATAPPEKDCRICHLGVETSGGGGAIELGCSCKEDLAVAHRQCAETWFKIKGDKICEICQSLARNVGGANEVVVSTEEVRELSNGGGSEETAAGGGATVVENRWQPQRLVNLVLACMVFGFIVSWLLHFNVSSSS